MNKEFKVAKCRLVMTLRDSPDQKVRNAGVQKMSGRKWSAATEVDQSESMLALCDIIGNICRGREGIGVSHFKQWPRQTKLRRGAWFKEK